MYEQEAQERGWKTATLVQYFRDVDRAVLDGETQGFVKVLVKKNSDQILGATIVASHAGEMISELTLAMVGELGLKTIGQTIHAYPTQADAIRKVADALNRQRLTPFVQKTLRRWFSWMR
jgi:pyruvate/2-oxoglutarate dehydrogenase complex dihydrolipoamide dehydrogenase (E3) component